MQVLGFQMLWEIHLTLGFCAQGSRDPISSYLNSYEASSLPSWHFVQWGWLERKTLCTTKLSNMNNRTYYWHFLKS